MESEIIPSGEVALTDTESSAFKDFAAYAAMIDERKDLSTRLKAIEIQIDKITPRLMNYFETSGITSVRVNRVTIFLRRELWARPKLSGDRNRVCLALQAAGMGHFVEPNYNAQTLSAWVRNLEDQHIEEITEQGKTVADFLPPGVAAVLSVEPTWKIQGRKTA
jgi:hypothetical protein